MRLRLSRNSTIAMNKTLMTLAALAAVSASASADGTLKWDLTFTDTAYSFTGSELARVSTGYNFTLVNGVFTTSGSGSRLLLGEYEDKALAMNTSFSLVIQGGLAVEPADGGVLFAFGDANGKYFTISAGADGQLVMSPEGYESAAAPCTGGSVATGLGTYIVTYDVTTGTDGEETALVSLYQNGALVASTTAPAVSDQKLMSYSVGGLLDDASSRLTQFSLTTVQLYEGALSSEQIAELSVTAATPEPTTATLSLLALAGLCARRRRK